ncbi:MAG TPA: hypothetical protein VK528_14415 [Flavobacterium sp.]|nr:hypothetical protein [Flavobacterium sp.]
MGDIAEWLKKRLEWLLLAVFGGMSAAIVALYTTNQLLQNGCDDRVKEAVAAVTKKDSIEFDKKDAIIKEQGAKIYDLLTSYKTEWLSAREELINQKEKK